jgi:MFS transporter, FHS family, Na+ dependent glucose transporter 1
MVYSKQSIVTPALPHPSRSAIPGYLSSFVAMGVCTMLLGPSLESFRQVSGTAAADIGILFTASSIGYLLGVTASGQWVAQHSAHAALAMGIVMMASAAALLPSMQSLSAIFAFEILLGFGIGWIEIPANSGILWNHGGGRAINALHACFAIGAVLAPIIVGRSIAWTHGLGAGYAIAACIAIIPLCLIARVASPRNPHEDHGRGIPTGSRTLVIVGAVFFALYVGAEMTFAGWIYRYVETRGFANASDATVFGALFLAAFAVGRIVGIPIARHLSALQTLYLDHAIALAALAVLAIGRFSVVALVMGTVLFGVGIASMFASMLSLSNDHVAATGTVTSLYLIGSSVGTMTLPWATGRLLSRFGPGALPAVAATSTVLTLAAVTVFVAVAKRQLPRHT